MGVIYGVEGVGCPKIGDIRTQGYLYGIWGVDIGIPLLWETTKHLNSFPSPVPLYKEYMAGRRAHSCQGAVYTGPCASAYRAHVDHLKRSGNS